MLYTESQKQEHIEEILGLLYQIALRDSRIPIVLPAKEFTEEAALAVRAYQEAYGLPVTGEMGFDRGHLSPAAGCRRAAGAVSRRRIHAAGGRRR